MGKNIADCPRPHQPDCRKGLRRMNVVYILPAGRNQPSVFQQALHIFQAQGFFYVPKISFSMHHSEKGKASSRRFNCLYPAHLGRITGNAGKKYILTGLREFFRQEPEKIFMLVT